MWRARWRTVQALLGCDEALSLRMVDYLASHNTTAGWRKQYAEVKSAPEVLPSTADYERFKHLVDQSLALPPMSKRPQGRPRKGGDFRALRIKLKRAMASPRKKDEKPQRAVFATRLGVQQTDAKISTP